MSEEEVSEPTSNVVKKKMTTEQSNSFKEENGSSSTNLNTNSDSNIEETKIDNQEAISVSINSIKSNEEEDNCQNEVTVGKDDNVQLSIITESEKELPNQNIEKEKSEETSVDLYVVCNKNTSEPCDNSNRIEDVGNLNTYRDNIDEGTDNSDSSDSESSSTVSEDDEDDNDNNSSGDKQDLSNKKALNLIRTKGELSLEDLPPIEDLEISVDGSKCKEIGTIDSIVATQVVIQTFPNTPTLDLDTVLFLDCGQRPLGKIFDVLGNIRGPFYVVRFNSEEHIREKNIRKHQTVYFVPDSEYTSYVNTTELMKNKGSDASWYHNNEPPETCLDFSDDEEEARSKRTLAVVGSKRDSQVDNDLFVKKMNQKNLELTAKRRKEDEAKQKRVPLARRMISNAKNNSIEIANFNSHGYSQFADNYKLKGRPFPNSDQPAAVRVVNFHHNPSNTQANKFDPVSRSVNFLVGGYSSPSNYAFPPQHYLYSSPRQLPSVVSNAQNYLTMYSRPPIQTTNTMPPPPPPPPPTFSNFTSSNISAMTPAFSPRPGLHPALQPSLHGPIPPQFSSFNPVSVPPLPSSLPQPYFSCTETPNVPQPTFIPLNVRPGISPATFHQFVLPPPPPPPPSSIQHHSHPRDVPLSRPDRRNHPPPHSNASYYAHSPYNS